MAVELVLGSKQRVIVQIGCPKRSSFIGIVGVTRPVARPINRECVGIAKTLSGGRVLTHRTSNYERDNQNQSSHGDFPELETTQRSQLKATVHGKLGHRSCQAKKITKSKRGPPIPLRSASNGFCLSSQSPQQPQRETASLQHRLAACATKRASPDRDCGTFQATARAAPLFLGWGRAVLPR